MSSKLLLLLRETRWMLLVACALYFTVALYGYNPADPAWSHSVTGVHVTNPAGMLGAYLSDLLFYLFGFSAWWFVLFMLQRVWAGYHRLRADSIFCKRTLLVSVAGFAALLLASSALEFLRLYTLKVALPLVHGGMLGEVLGKALARGLGFTGATLLLLTLIATGFSLFSGLSWLRFVDWLGERIEAAVLWARLSWQTRQDRRIGMHATHERVAVVEEEKKKRIEDHQPIHIEMPLMEVAKSARAVQERQVSLVRRCRLAAAAAASAGSGGAAGRGGFRRHAGDDLAPDRAEAEGLRRRGAGGGGLSRPGDHALRDRAGRRRQGRADRQPGQGPGARAVGGQHPRGRDDPRQDVHGAGDAQREAADRDACPRSWARRSTTTSRRR